MSTDVWKEEYIFWKSPRPNAWHVGPGNEYVSETGEGGGGGGEMLLRNYLQALPNKYVMDCFDSSWILPAKAPHRWLALPNQQFSAHASVLVCASHRALLQQGFGRTALRNQSVGASGGARSSRIVLCIIYLLLLFIHFYILFIILLKKKSAVSSQDDGEVLLRR